jgi:hypothetical protein
MPDTQAARSIYAIWALLCPLTCVLFGLTLAFIRPQAGDFVTVLVWSGLAAVSGVFCAIRSVLLRERWRALAIAGALLSLVPVALVLIALSNLRFAF